MLAGGVREGPHPRSAVKACNAAPSTVAAPSRHSIDIDLVATTVIAPGGSCSIIRRGRIGGIHGILAGRVREGAHPRSAVKACNAAPSIVAAPSRHSIDIDLVATTVIAPSSTVHGEESKDECGGHDNHHCRRGHFGNDLCECMRAGSIT